MSQATQTTKLPSTSPSRSVGSPGGSPATGDDAARLRTATGGGGGGGGGGGAGGGGGSTTLILVAAGVALLAVLAVNLYVEYVKRTNTPDTMTIYRLRVPVETGERLKEKVLVPMQVPREFDAALGHPVQAYQLANYLADDPPKRFTRPGAENAVLTHQMLTETDLERLDFEITPQFRFVAFPVDTSRVPGQVTPEMRVDLVGQFVVDGRLEWLPVMDNVEVKLVGNWSAQQEADTVGSRGGGRYKTLTVQVTPEQALALQNIRQLAAGDFIVFLRSPSDDETPLSKTEAINPVLLRMIGEGGSGGAGSLE